jgi:uncharacterized protein (TIGR03790 family)
MKIRIILFLLFSAPLYSQTADNVLLILNEASPISIDIGKYYAQKHGVSQSNSLRIKTTTEETISREDFERQISAPIVGWLTRSFAQDRILYIVLTKGIPLRITGTSGQNGTTASVDSELTLIYQKMLGQKTSISGFVENPYFLGEKPISQARQFSHSDQNIYLVSRLDGYNFADIQALIDHGAAPSREGKILLDAKGAPTQKGDIWLQESADLLTKMGFKDRVMLETTGKVLTEVKQVIGYYSWGANDPAIRMRHFGFEFVPGGLAGMYVSSDARTFKDTGDWKIEKSGSPQSLAADLIHDGVTGIAGHVSEPFLDGTIRPHILFPAYLSGFNLIESYYLAMPYLSWQTIVIGDPLCAPFRVTSLAPKEIDKPINPDTELPQDFGTRRFRALSVSAFSQAGVHPDTIRWILRAEARMVKQDMTGARRAYEESISRDDRLAIPQLQLAQLYELEGDYDKAIGRYRRLQQLMPEDPIVLNNLAYALAVKKNSIQEALPLAEKAYELAKSSASISDTLGWIYHLAGQDGKAAKLIGEAVKAAPENAEVQFHYAVISALAGNNSAAEAALKRALEINPKLEQSEEVKQLQAKLK